LRTIEDAYVQFGPQASINRDSAMALSPEAARVLNPSFEMTRVWLKFAHVVGLT